MKKILSLVLVAVLALSLCACGQSQTDDPTDDSAESSSAYPDGQPITIYLGQAAGGSTDTVVRNWLPYLNKYLDTNVVVENITGGSGKVALAQYAKVEADGYTLLCTALPAWYLTQVSDAAPSYDLKNFIPLGGLNGHDPNCFATAPGSGLDTIEDILELAKTRTVTMAGSGIGGNGYFAYFLLRQFTGADIQFVPFDSGSEAITAVMGGNADCVVTSAISVLNRVNEGSLQCLAVCGPERDATLPEVPTMEELGYEGFAYDVSFGLCAQEGTPDEIVKILQEAIANVANDPDFIAACEKGNLGYFPMSADEYAAYLEETYAFVDSYKEAFLEEVANSANA